jgi:3-oxoadipate enol-lactonase
MLAAEHDVIAWDQPGQGDSDRMGEHWRIEDYADCVVEVLDRLEVETATIVGASAGGAICAAVGAHHGERVDGLVFVDTQCRDPAWWEARWSLVERNCELAASGACDAAQFVAPLAPEVLERIGGDRRKAGIETLLAMMRAVREFDLYCALEQLSAPALLLFGARGPAVSAADEFGSRVPFAEVVVLPSSGHYPMIDEPAEFATEIRRFVAARGRAPIGTGAR